MTNVSKDDYEHALRVWKEFGIHNLGDYHNLYLQTDVILLANVFEAFRDTCLEHYKLDPAHFYTSPGLAWKACLRKTRVIKPNDISRLAKVKDKGYLLEVDIKYPKELHDLHNDLPFMCERMKINGVEKLVPNLKDKKNYVIHIQALDQALPTD